MDINELTLGQAKELAALFGNKTSEAEPTFTPHISKKCIVRTYASGVFFGTVVAQSGRMVEISECRRLWSWKASEGISLSAVAVHGVDPKNCRFPVATPTQTVLDALEIIPASPACITSIESTKPAEAS